MCVEECVFPFLWQYSISLPTDQRLSHGGVYFLKFIIRFLSSLPSHFLLIYQQFSIGLVQWKHFPLLYQNHEFPSFLYTERMELHLELYFQQYWCNNENLNLSYTTSPLKKFQKNYFMDPNQIHLKIEDFDIHGDHRQ